MATTPYKPTSWSVGEQITREKLNQMCANEQWIFENQPNVMFDAHGIKKNSGIKMYSGLISFGSNSTTHQEKQVYFGNFFAVGCKPIVLLTPIMQTQSRIMCMVRGLPGEYWPDHRGFTVVMDTAEINPKNNYFHYSSSAHYLAIGY